MMPSAALKFVLPCLALVTMSIPPSARAADTLVAWSGDMVTAYLDLNLPVPVDSETTRTWPYSDTVTVHPSSGYSGIPLYGVFMTDRTGASPGPVNFTEIRIRNLGATDDLRFSISPGSDTGTIQGLVFMVQDDFANHADATVTFDTNSTVFIDVTAQGGTSSGNGWGTRAAVRDGGTWYLSQSISTTYGGDINITNAASALWGAWDPSGTPLGATPTAFATSGASFTDIQAVGFYFFLSRPANISQLQVSEITVTGVGTPSGTPGTAIIIP